MVVWAEFIPVEDDTEPELDVDDVYNVSGAFDLTLKIESRSLPMVTLSGLPSGLKFDKKTNRISGTAKKPGTYTVTAKLANASVKRRAFGHSSSLSATFQEETNKRARTAGSPARWSTTTPTSGC